MKLKIKSSSNKYKKDYKGCDIVYSLEEALNESYYTDRYNGCLENLESHIQNITAFLALVMEHTLDKRTIMELLNNRYYDGTFEIMEE